MNASQRYEARVARVEDSATYLLQVAARFNDLDPDSDRRKAGRRQLFAAARAYARALETLARKGRK